eukprot:GHVN01078195.1.p1 GENE.GHVN01078195.1~~GHVN01078195.1.p1  ORF type:complete len:135 (-),score=18.50 GHVN01078195.1:398-802(-)
MKALITRRINEAKEDKMERKEAGPSPPVNGRGQKPQVEQEQVSDEDGSSTRRARQWELEDDKESSDIGEDSPTMSEIRHRQEEGVKRRERMMMRKAKAEERATRCKRGAWVPRRIYKSELQRRLFKRPRLRVSG